MPDLHIPEGLKKQIIVNEVRGKFISHKLLPTHAKAMAKFTGNLVKARLRLSLFLLLNLSATAATTIFCCSEENKEKNIYLKLTRYKTYKTFLYF